MSYQIYHFIDFHPFVVREDHLLGALATPSSIVILCKIQNSKYPFS